jgi:hypothetical protein
MRSVEGAREAVRRRWIARVFGFAGGKKECITLLGEETKETASNDAGAARYAGRLVTRDSTNAVDGKKWRKRRKGKSESMNIQVGGYIPLVRTRTHTNSSLDGMGG